MIGECFWGWWFDEDFFAHLEEIDLCWRLMNKVQNNGWPQATVFCGSGDFAYEIMAKDLFLYGNNALLLIKNLPIQWLTKFCSLVCSYDFAAALKFLVMRI
jgi:GT2 family glycosyltransferase